MRRRRLPIWVVLASLGFLAPALARAETYTWESHWRAGADHKVTKEYRFRAEGAGVRDRLERWRLSGEDWPWTFWEGLLLSLEGGDRRVERAAEPARGEIGHEGVTARWKFEGLALTQARRDGAQWVFHPPPLDDPGLVVSTGTDRSRWNYAQREVRLRVSWRVEAPGPRAAVLRAEDTFGAPGLEAKVSLRPLLKEEAATGNVGWEWVSEVWTRSTALSQKEIAAQWAAYRAWVSERTAPIVWRAELKAPRLSGETIR